MFILLKNGKVFTPKYQGEKDILVGCGKILKISDKISPPKNFLDIKEIDAKNLNIIPGLIDGHVHFSGGGGEGGFKNRTPEVVLSSLTSSGITTAVGLLGSDATTRTTAGLLAKARALEAEGITTYILTGAYQIPTRTITDNPRSDIILIDKVIGIGEIALADHRSSHPSEFELTRLASEARMGGLISGKAGILNIHIGDGNHGLASLFTLVNNTDIPVNQFLPTHLNRNRKLLEHAVKFTKMGGTVDITSGIFPTHWDKNPYKPSNFIKILLQKGVPIEQITMSSDANGSSPVFDEKGNLVRLDIGRPSTLWSEFKDLVVEEGIKLEDAVKTLTSNVAKTLKLENKGILEPNKDSDMVVFNNGFNIIHVIAKGRLVVENTVPLVFGTFERT